MSDMEAIERWRAKLSPPPPVVPVRRERQCLNDAGQPKARHPTKQGARAAMKIIKRRPDFVERPGRPIHVYRCPTCNFWHVGKTPKTAPPSPPAS